LLQLQSDLIILRPHLSVSASPAPLNHSSLLVTFPAFVFVPHACDNFGSVSSRIQNGQPVNLVVDHIIVPGSLTKMFSLILVAETPIYARQLSIASLWQGPLVRGCQPVALEKHTRYNAIPSGKQQGLAIMNRRMRPGNSSFRYGEYLITKEVAVSSSNRP
jgi:hypothetical protein